jgi:hypothetical protein
MCRRYVRHIERGVLPHQDDVCFAKIAKSSGAKGKVIAPPVAHFQRPDLRGNRTVAQRKIAGPVIKELMPALLCFQRQCEGGVAGNINPLYGIHLDGNC